MDMNNKEAGSELCGLSIHFINELLVLLLGDLPLEFEGGSELSAIDTEVDWEEFPLADVGSSGNSLLVSLLEGLLDELLDLVVGAGLI